MSTCVTTLPKCPAIQGELATDFTNCDYGRKRDAYGFLEYLISPSNRGDIVQKISPGGGKLRKVELIYTPRILESQVNNTASKVCNSTNEFGANVTEYTLNQNEGVEINFVVNPANLAEVCEDDERWISKVLNYMMDAAIRKMHTDIVNQLLLKVGPFGAGDTNQDGSAIANNEKVLSSRMGPSNAWAPDYRFISEIEYSAKNMEYCGNPLLFGWGDSFKAFSLLRAACCADNGMDMGELARTSGLAFLADKKIGSVIGLDKMIMIDSGALQVLEWNEYATRGVSYIDTENYKQTQIIDPRTGIRFDFTAKLDCGVWHFSIKKAFKLVGLPTDMYCAQDELAGLTYVNKFKIVNPTT